VKTFQKRERGTVLVENVMVMMTFFIITIGMIELGLGVWAYNTVAHAARQGTRYAIVHGDGYCGCTDDEHRSAIQTATINAAIGLKLTTANVAVSSPGGYAIGSNVTVTVTYTYGFFSRVLPRASVTLRSTSTMVISY